MVGQRALRAGCVAIPKQEGRGGGAPGVLGHPGTLTVGARPGIVTLVAEGPATETAMQVELASTAAARLVESLREATDEAAGCAQRQARMPDAADPAPVDWPRPSEARGPSYAGGGLVGEHERDLLVRAFELGAGRSPDDAELRRLMDWVGRARLEYQMTEFVLDGRLEITRIEDGTPVFRPGAAFWPSGGRS